MFYLMGEEAVVFEERGEMERAPRTYRGADFLLVHHVLVAHVGVCRQPLELTHELLLYSRSRAGDGEK